MSRDANQIAQEEARREKHLQQGRPVDGSVVKRGTLTVMTSLGDAAEVVTTLRHVTAQFTPSGLIVATQRDGAKIVFNPIPGWCVMFEPNDAGE